MIWGFVIPSMFIIVAMLHPRGPIWGCVLGGIGVFATYLLTEPFVNGLNMPLWLGSLIAATICVVGINPWVIGRIRRTVNRPRPTPPQQY